MQSLTETLSERVERLVRANRTPVLSTTPPSVAVAELATRIEALEDALWNSRATFLQATTPADGCSRRNAPDRVDEIRGRIVIRGLWATSVLLGVGFVMRELLR